MIVIKVGGNDLGKPAFLAGFAQAVAGLSKRPVIVHGGGRGTTLLMKQFGLEARFLEGLRVTDEQTLELAIMGMIGQASTQLVQALVNEGLPALGLSGIDAALVTAEKLMIASGDLGAVGKPVAVAADRLRALLESDFLPCIAPISRGADGQLFNVNGDTVAQAVAGALQAETLIFLTNVPAVLRDGEPIATLTAEEVEQEIANGVIIGGMIPKTRGAVAAVEAGVERAIITNLTGLQAIAAGKPAGTAVVSG
ncbi:MAG: acetylglutamate kinase [Ardenticatenaceae bacterium]